VIETEIRRGITPIAETWDIAEQGATGQHGDRPGGTGSRLDASFDEAELDEAVESGSVQWFVRKCPAEEDGTMLQTQMIAFKQNESYGLHRTDAQILFPWLDVERG
jgi:hypothetical protein